MSNRGKYMPKPAVYLRVSSEIQRTKESIKSQEEALTAWLALQGLTPADVSWYKDDGVSGKDPILSRGDGARLARDIEAGAVGGFVAAFSISRLARDAADFLVKTLYTRPASQSSYAGAHRELFQCSRCTLC
jgi:DNA invertase Pin-like site-specific DNA recombinase